MNDNEWWPMSAALAWIAVRKPLTFDEWTEDVAPPRAGPSRWLAADIVVPDSARALLVRQDDGAGDALDALAALLIAAASKGDVKMRGRGPWTIMPTDKPGVMDETQVAQAVVAEISKAEFTPEGLALMPAGESIGPDDSVRHSGIFRRWRRVEACAADLRAVWPSTDTMTAVPQAELVQVSILKTGVAGRPTTKHLFNPEHARRIASGEALGPLADEAEHLRNWIDQKHPGVPLPTAKAIKNEIRGRHPKGPK